MTPNKKFPRLCKKVAQHEKRAERFMREASAFFHPYAVELCKRIQRDIPEFEGCELAMRHLYLNPRNLPITVITPDGQEEQERLANIIDGGYLDADGSGMSEWKAKLPQRTQRALLELDELANYIDDNYSMVDELYVVIRPKKKFVDPEA